MKAKPKEAKLEEEKGVSEEPADFEYLELTNTSEAQVIDLTGSEFTDGIKLSFDQAAITILKPQEKLYLVRNRKAFTARYGEEMAKRIAGIYAPSKLKNEGERIALVNGAGEILLEYAYKER